MIILLMNVKTWLLKTDRDSGSTRQASMQILADSDTGLEVEVYLNI